MLVRWTKIFPLFIMLFKRLSYRTENLLTILLQWASQKRISDIIDSHMDRNEHEMRLGDFRRHARPFFCLCLEVPA
jgi:hypothetical protein